MALALDGSIHGNSGSASSLAVTLSTSNSNDIICVAATVNSGPVVSVTATGLTFTKRSASAGSGAIIEFWTAVAASPLSSKVITVTQSAGNFITVDAFGVSGANTSTIFDSNGSLPATSAGASVTISTSNANDMLLEMGRGSSSPSTDAGFTVISSADFQACAYKIVSSTQSSLTMNIGGGNGVLGDAIIQASAAPTAAFRRTLSALGTRTGTRQGQG